MSCKVFKFLGLIASIPVVFATSSPVNAWEPSDYEVWIVSKRMNEGIGKIARPNCGISTTGIKCEDVGHAWIAVVYKDAMNYWAVDQTIGFWDVGGLQYNKEKDDTIKIINHQSISKRNHSVRKMKVTKSRANWLKKNVVNQTGCKQYATPPIFSDQCNCVTFAIKVWDKATEHQENFAGIYNIEPDNLANVLDDKNSLGDFVSGGKRWE